MQLSFLSIFPGTDPDKFTQKVKDRHPSEGDLKTLPDKQFAKWGCQCEDGFVLFALD